MAENAALGSPFISYGSPEELPPPGSLQNQLEGISLHPWEVQHEHCPLKQIPPDQPGMPISFFCTFWGGMSACPVALPIQ